MAGDKPNYLIADKLTYTFNEAIKYMKTQDITSKPTRWIDVRTKKEVIIGYTQ